MGRAVTVVEWGDRVSALLPVDRLDVLLTPGDGDDDRLVTFAPAGRSWAVRGDALATLVDAAAATKGRADVLVLAIDTATTRVSAAIGDGGAVHRRGVTRRWSASRRAARPRDPVPVP